MSYSSENHNPNNVSQNRTPPAVLLDFPIPPSTSKTLEEPSSRNIRLQKLSPGESFEVGTYYKAQVHGIIGDALVYPGNTIKIERIISKGDGGFCSLETGDIYEGWKEECIELIFEGGVMRTTRSNIESILGGKKDIIGSSKQKQGRV